MKRILAMMALAFVCTANFSALDITEEEKTVTIQGCEGNVLVQVENQDGAISTYNYGQDKPADEYSLIQANGRIQEPYHKENKIEELALVTAKPMEAAGTNMQDQADLRELGLGAIAMVEVLFILLAAIGGKKVF